MWKVGIKGSFVVFYLGYDEGELRVMFRGLIVCLEEVLGWFEGLV